MRIGIDFDNTIACYDGVFHAAAVERGLISEDISRDKNSVRDFLNSSGRKDVFTELQGYVYGSRMDLVACYPGVRDFITAAVLKNYEIFIISHKTRHPILGPRHDMHAAARAFLIDRRIVGDDGVHAEKVFFELTKEDKLARATQLRVDVFIDDLPEILAMTGWSKHVRAILFEPDGHTCSEFWKGPNRECYSSWAAISHALLGT
jgi:hypothetical protein